MRRRWTMSCVGVLLAFAGMTHARAQTAPGADASAPASPSPEVPSSSLQDELVDGVQRFYESTSSFKAEFTQTVVRRFRPGGQKSTPRKGVAYFLKPGRMRWDYQSPEAVYYVSNGETLWVYEPEQNRAYKGAVKGSRLYDSMKFLFGAAKLREEFSVSVGVSTEATAELVLVPKSGQMDFQKLVLVVARTSFEIRETRLVDPAGDESVISFSNAVYGPISNPEWFDWTPGEGVKVDDLSARGGLQ